MVTRSWEAWDAAWAVDGPTRAGTDIAKWREEAAGRLDRAFGRLPKQQQQLLGGLRRWDDKETIQVLYEAELQEELRRHEAEAAMVAALDAPAAPVAEEEEGTVEDRAVWDRREQAKKARIGASRLVRAGTGGLDEDEG